MELDKLSTESLADHVVSLSNYIRDGLSVVGAACVFSISVRLLWAVLKWKAAILKRLVFGRTSLKERYGSWAIVTGCTQGIGEEFCEQLAKDGMNLLLIGRRANMAEIAQKYTDRHGVRTDSLQIDFNQPFTRVERQLVAAKLAEIDDVGVLINNVGVMYDHPMYFHEVEAEKCDEVLQVNCSSCTHLSHVVLGHWLRHSHRGLIVFMSSVCGLLPPPLMTQYAAAKAYVQFLAIGLSAEYRAYGIDVFSFTPSFIATQMASYSDQVSKPNFLDVVSPKDFVASALHTLTYSVGSLTSAGTLKHRLLLSISQWLPLSWYLRFAMVKTGSLRRDALDIQRKSQ